MAPQTTELQSYLLQHIKRHLAQKHEKPVYDEYNEGMKALRNGQQSGHAGASDRRSLETTARLRLEDGLKAVQPDIANDMKPYEHLIISEYQLLAEPLMQVNEEVNEEPLRFTRAEVAEAHEKWIAMRTSKGLPIDGDCDDLAPPEPADGQGEDSDSTAEEDSSTDTLDGEQSNAGSIDEPIDLESENLEEDASESSFTVDGVDSSESGC